MENIPEEVINWLETKPFSALSPKEKELASHFFSVEEYNRLYQTMRLVKNSMPAFSENNKEKIRAQLLAKFDALHPRKNNPKPKEVYFSPFSFWQAASIVLLGCSGWLSFILLTENQTPLQTTKTIKDTVFLVKEVISAPVHLVDTIYIRQKIESSETRSIQKEMPMALAEIAPNYPSSNQMGLEPLPVMPFTDLESPANNPKKNSLRDDSLIKHLPIVSL